MIYLFALLNCASLYSWAKVKLAHTEEFINHAVCSHTKAKHPNCTKMFVDWPALNKDGNHIARNVRGFRSEGRDRCFLFSKPCEPVVGGGGGASFCFHRKLYSLAAWG